MCAFNPIKVNKCPMVAGRLAPSAHSWDLRVQVGDSELTSNGHVLANVRGNVTIFAFANERRIPWPTRLACVACTKAGIARGITTETVLLTSV